MSEWACKRCGSRLKVSNVGFYCEQCGAKYVLRRKDLGTTPLNAQGEYFAPEKKLFDDIPDEAILPDRQFALDFRNEVVQTLWSNGFTGAKMDSMVYGHSVALCYVKEDPASASRHEPLTALLKNLPKDRVYYDGNKEAYCVERAWEKPFTMQFGRLLADEKTDALYDGLPAFETGFPIGRYATNEVAFTDFSETDSLLITGGPKTGKTTFLHSMLLGLMARYSPSEVRFLPIEPKTENFSCYEGSPHLLTGRVVHGLAEGLRALEWATRESDRRLEMVKACFGERAWNRCFYELNACMGKESRLPRIVIAIDGFDRLADEYGLSFLEKTQRIAKISRKTGVHLVMTSNRPGSLYGQRDLYFFRARLAFKVEKENESVNAIRFPGAETLAPRGEFLLRCLGDGLPRRITAPYVELQHRLRIIEYVKRHNEARFDGEAAAFINGSDTTSD